MKTRFLLACLLMATPASAAYNFGTWLLMTEKVFKKSNIMACVLSMQEEGTVLEVRGSKGTDGQRYRRVSVKHTPSIAESYGISSDPWKKLGEVDTLIFAFDGQIVPVPVQFYEQNETVVYQVRAPRSETVDLSKQTDDILKASEEDERKADKVIKVLIDTLRQAKMLEIGSEYSRDIHPVFDLKDFQDVFPFFERCEKNDGKL